MIELIKSDLKKYLSLERYNHTIRVCETAIELARIYNENVEDATIAALLHDYVKCLDKKHYREIIRKNNLKIDSVIEKNIGLAHGLISAYFAKEKYRIENIDILNAIEYHTYGRPDMSTLEKIIYLADYIEPGRSFDGVDEIRETAKKDLNKAMIMALESSMDYVKSVGKEVHPLSMQAMIFIQNEV